MKTLFIVPLIFAVLGNAACHYDEQPNLATFAFPNLSDLPADVFQELMIIVKGQRLTESVTCDDVEPSDFDLFLYTRNNTLDPLVLNAKHPAPVSADKPFIVVTHGWLQSYQGYKMQQVKNAFLERYDANVIIINWKKLGWDTYTRAVCKLPKIAKIVATFLYITNQHTGVQYSDMHVVGHSLGGQMAGYIGHYSNMVSTEKIGKITGLDPAGPLYADAPKDRRLDESDAQFVSVFHTNGGVFGYLSKCGHADFFINCGTAQPGCIVPSLDVNSLLKYPIMTVGCAHFRAMDIMVEAIQTNDFHAIPCNYCPVGCPPVMSIFKQRTPMGESTPADARGGYYLVTDIRSPYAIKFTP